MMSGIRSKNTGPELVVRRLLYAAGFRFRLHVRDLPGKPDIVMVGRHVAIFVHGCFWHRHEACKFARSPASRRDFWAGKLTANVARDQRAIEALRDDGWRVLTVWECAIRDPVSLASLKEAMASWIGSSEPLGEIRGFSTPPGS